MVLEYLPMALQVAGSIFGKDKNAGKASPTAPGGAQQLQGFAAAPQEVQNAYLQHYLPAVLQQFKQGGTQLAPFYQYQQQALQSLGGGLSGLQSEVPGYQNFYNQQVFNPFYRDLYNQHVLQPELENINDLYGQAQSNLTRSANNGNLGGLYSTAFGGQLAGLQEAAARMKREARQQAFLNATNLGAGAFNNAVTARRQTLADLLQAGGQPQARIAEFGTNLGNFPGSQTSNSYAALPPKPNFASQLGGIGGFLNTAMGGSGGGAGGAGNLFGGSGGVTPAVPFTGNNLAQAFPSGGPNWRWGA